MKILVGGILHESNTFASTRADRRRFLDGSFAAGPDIIPIWESAHHELGGFIESSSQFDFALAPSIMAWATPSGPVDDEVLDEVTDRLIADCRANQVDGVLLALHGAMVTENHPSADTEVVRRIRAAVGPNLPVSVSLDFHANCDPAMADFADTLVGYQTYPHVDQRERGLLAAELLVRTIRKEIKPVCHVAKRPMIANILGQATERRTNEGADDRGPRG